MKWLIKIAVMFQMLIFSCDTEKSEFTVKLSSVDPDSGGYYFMGMGAERRSKNKDLLLKEKIIKHPENLKLIKNFFISLQPRQHYMNVAQENENSMKLVLETLRLETYDELKINYSEEYVDCIISIGVYEDGQKNTVVIIDQNNDEDLSNDSLLNFRKHVVYHGPNRARFKMESVNTNATTQLFDGEKIINKTYPVRFSKIKSPKQGANPVYLYSLRSMKIGYWTIGENTFKIGLLNKNSQAEYSLSDRLWIDSNLNNFYDQNDLSESMFYPFLFDGKVYEVKSLHRLGTEIVIQKAEKKLLKDGGPAPEIESVSIDSIPFKLSDLKNKFVLINFWGTW